MSTPVAAGIDPGILGAVAVVDLAGRLVEAFDQPYVEVFKETKKGTSKRKVHDVDGMIAVLEKVKALGDVRMVVLELVDPMPMKRKRGATELADAAGKDLAEGWGATPNFNLGLGYGLWWALVRAARLPLERVRPVSWRAVMLKGLPRGKASGLVRARELWPGSDYFARVKDNGRADASLLAEYGARVIRGGG